MKYPDMQLFGFTVKYIISFYCHLVRLTEYYWEVEETLHIHVDFLFNLIDVYTEYS